MQRFRKWLVRDRFSAVQYLSRMIGEWLNNHLTANQITLIGMVLAIPMFFFFLYDNVLIGGVLLVFSLLTDFIDGALARYQQKDDPIITLEQELGMSFIARINYRGVTHLGRSLDPLADKVRFFLVLYPLGWGYVHIGLILSITLVALVLTVIRPFKQKMGLDHVGSNRFGKFKIWAEIVGISVLVLVPNNLLLLLEWYVATNLIFSIALLLGILSLSGHFYTGSIARDVKLRRKQKKLDKERKKLLKQVEKLEKQSDRSKMRKAQQTRKMLRQ